MSAPWTHAGAALEQRLAPLCDRESLAPILARHSQIELDDGTCEPARLKLMRSMAKFLSPGSPARAHSLAAVALALGRGPEVLPLVDDVERLVFSPFAVDALHTQRGLTISAPCARPDSAAVSIVKRYMQDDGRLILKLRMGAYLDLDGSLWWELGIAAGVEPGAYAPEARKHTPRRMRVPLSAMSGAVRGLAAMARSHGACSIDLTPSHASVLPLCLWLGAVPDDAQGVHDPAADDRTGWTRGRFMYPLSARDFD